jgi:hypothetical protein
MDRGVKCLCRKTKTERIKNILKWQAVSVSTKSACPCTAINAVCFHPLHWDDVVFEISSSDEYESRVISGRK